MERDSPANIDVGKEAKEGDQTKKRMSLAEKMVKKQKKTAKKTNKFHFRQDVEQRRPKSKWMKCGRKINYACKKREKARVRRNMKLQK